MTALAERTEYYDLTVKQEKIFEMDLWEQNSHEEYADSVIYSGGTVRLPLGTQFYLGEPVQLWAVVSTDGSDIYLYRKDGSGELVLEGVPNSYTSASESCQWYIDREGNFYCRYRKYSQINGEYSTQGFCVKILSSGEILPSNEMETDIIITDLCQTEEGRIYLLLEDRQENKYYLEEMDSDTGLCIPESRTELSLQYQVYLGNGGAFPAVTGYNLEDISRRIMTINPEDETMSLVLSFSGTSYELRTDLELQDCRVLEDGSVELLWTQRNGTGGLRESLKMEKVDKDILVLRGVFWHDAWLTNKINQFNSASSTYHVILEDCTDGREWEDFFRLTNVQIGAGKGPDILGGNVLPQEYISGMLEKGALEELTPYMEAAGIREEDYFPLTFATWRQGENIYSVNSRMSLWGEMIDGEVLGSSEIPDMETLADALLAQEQDGVYFEGWDSGEVLRSFYQGTDSLWGMVDWESGTCDFNTPLFGKLLEAARRHGDDGRKNPESTIVSKRYVDCILDYNRNAEGQVTSGVLFDDGCHLVSFPTYTLAINANSPHKDGAWEFICSLISEEAQTGDMVYHEAPVNRKAYELWTQWSIRQLAEVSYENGVAIYPIYYGTDVSEEKQAALIKEIENAAPLPLRTEPILEIILEEAEDYFRGYKSAEEIRSVVNNRVQLYLNERK